MCITTLPARAQARRFTNISPDMKDTRGGARPGAGRPHKTITAEQAERLLNAAEEITTQEGLSPYRLLMEYAYGIGKGSEFPPSTRAQALSRYFDLTMARLHEGSEADQILGPAIYLPEERPDPAKVVNIR